MSSVTVSQSSPTASKPLRIALWTVQVLVALLFLNAGFMKTTGAIDELAKAMTWVARHSEGFVRFVGISELLGGLGLLLPALTRIKPQLTPVAASALALVMVLAAGEHLLNGEAAMIGINAVFGVLCLFVAWGRFRKAPIAPRA